MVYKIPQNISFMALQVLKTREEIEKILLGYGYIYDPSLNQFIMK